MHEIIESITKFNLIKNEEILSKLYNIISNQIQRQCKIKSDADALNVNIVYNIVYITLSMTH